MTMEPKTFRNGSVARRKTAGLSERTTARQAIRIGKPAGVAAPVDAGHMATVEAYISNVADQGIAIARKHFDIPADAGVHVRHDWTARTDEAKNPRSRGGLYTSRFVSYEADGELQAPAIEQHHGWPAISLRCAKHFPASPSFGDDLRMWSEYPAFQADREIGALIGNWETVAACLTLHELAHALHYGWLFRERDKPHGERWQRIYRTMRVGAGLVRDFDYTLAELEARFPADFVDELRDDFEKAIGVPCGHCGKDYFPKRFRLTKTGLNFCSGKCRAASHRKHLKNSPA